MAFSLRAGKSKRAPDAWSCLVRACVQATGVALVTLSGILITTTAQETPRSAAPVEAVQPQVTIRSQSNLVLVRVVVRDPRGEPVKNLKWADFQVLDDKKPQRISYFSFEDASANAAGPKTERGEIGAAQAQEETDMPQRFAAFFFDDFHLEFADLAQIREAAKRYLTKNLDAGARVAVFNASGNVHTDFTNDRAKLDQALSQLRIESRFQELHECPNLTNYEAQSIDDDLDPDALAVGIAKTIACLCDNSPNCPGAEQQTRAKAREIVASNDSGVESTLSALEGLVRRMAKTPGQRTIAMLSDGFLSKNKQYLMDTIIERALRANVIINAMDARGLYTTNIPSAEAAPSSSLLVNLSAMRMRAAGMAMNADAMDYLAEGTGGTFVHNSNDFEGGLGRISSLREASYMLGFSPENLRLDGKFHSLTVKLVNAQHLSVLARRGYWAPKRTQNAIVAENELVEQAIFSHQGMNDLAVQFRGKFTKVDQFTTRFILTASLDIHSVRFRKENGHYLDDLTLALALFDRDGNYVTGREKAFKMHLSDELLQRLAATRASMTETLDIKPGTYFVRAVVLDGNSQQLGTGDQTISVP
jgi:VWFA-related protein